MSKVSVAQVIAGVGLPTAKPKAQAGATKLAAAVKSVPLAPLPKSLVRPPAF